MLPVAPASCLHLRPAPVEVGARVGDQLGVDDLVPNPLDVLARELLGRLADAMLAGTAAPPGLTVVRILIGEVMRDAGALEVFQRLDLLRLVHRRSTVPFMRLRMPLALEPGIGGPLRRFSP